jgi:hypothetical protein
LTGVQSAGGACDIISGELHFSRCCGVDCSTSTQGQFLRASNSAHDSCVTLCTFVTCGLATGNAHGGLYYNGARRDLLEFLNFTSCTIASDQLGSAVYFAETGPRVVSYITVSKCAGGSAIEDSRELDQSITVLEYTNFYNNNHVSGLVEIYRGPIAVTSCVFFGNTPSGRELWYYYTPTATYTVTNCVFSGPIPSSPGLFGPGSGNIANSVTASYPLPQFGTGACPNEADVPIPSLTPTRTPGPTVAATATRTHSPVETPSRSDTPRPTSTPYSPDCDQISGLTTRYEQTPSCVEVIRCVFEDLSDSGLTYDAILWGGAISATGGLDFTGAIECTFSKCVAYSGAGGAIASDSDRTVVDRCCALSCAAFSEGQFLAVQPYDINADGTVSFSTLLECAPAADLEIVWPRMGAIDLFALTSQWVQYTNFTSCLLSPEADGTGTAIHLDTNGLSVLSYLTISRCSGNVAVDQEGWATACTIKYANFYDNVVPGAGCGLIRDSGSGIRLSNCIFQANQLTGDILVCTEGSPAAPPFVLENCVFSGSFPSAANVATLLGNGNRQNAQTASWPLPHLDTASCGAAAFVPTPTPTASSSAGFAPSTHFVPTAALPPTRAPDPSSGLPNSKALPNSLEFTNSQAAPASALVGSKILPDSAPFGATSDLRPTPQLPASQGAGASNGFEPTGLLVPRATVTDSPVPSVTETAMASVTISPDPSLTVSPAPSVTISPARSATVSPWPTPPELPTAVATHSPNNRPPETGSGVFGSLSVTTVAGVAAGAVVVIVGIIVLLVVCRKKPKSEDGLVEQDGLETETDPVWGGMIDPDDGLVSHQYDNPLAETVIIGDQDTDGDDD